MTRNKQKLEHLSEYLETDSSDEDPWRYFVKMPPEGKRVVRRLESNEDRLRHQVNVEPHRSGNILNDPDGFMCHICNVFVSKKNAKDHAESKKHQSYKTLTKKVVQNVIKQQNASIDYNVNETIQTRDNSSYCGPCSKPVPPADKLKHRISKDHLKAVENETTFNNFLEMFFETHPSVTESEHNESNVELDKILSLQTVGNEVAPIVGNKHTNSHKNVAIAEVNNNETLQINANQSAQSSKVLSLQTVGSEVAPNKHKNVAIAEVNNNETLQINANQSAQSAKINETENVKVPTTIKEVKKHELSIAQKEVLELKQYMVDIAEEYDVQLKAQFKVDDSLCVIARAPNGDRVRISVDAFHSYTYGVGFANCQLCKLLIDLDAKTKHNATLKHMKSVTIPINNEFRRQLNGLWYHDLIRNEMVLIDDIKPVITNNTASTTKPIENSKNNKKIKYCDVCCIEIHINNFVEHMKGKKHMLNEKTFKKKASKAEAENRNKIVQINTDNAIIKTDPKSVTNETSKLKETPPKSMDIPNFVQYLKDMVSKFNLNYKLPPVENNSVVIITPPGYKILVSVETFHSYKQLPTGLYCQMCELSIEGNVNEHIVSRTHVRNITLPVDNNFSRRRCKAWTHCLVCNIMVLAGYQHALPNPAHKFHNPTYEPTKPTTVQNTVPQNLMKYCNVCDRNMLSKDYTHHINGKQHIKNLNNSVTTIKITTTNDNTSNTTQKEVKTRELDFEKYLKDVAVKFKLDCKLPNVKDNGVILVTPSGCTEKFSVSIFHGYKQEEDAVFCQMCQVYVHNVNGHSLDKRHVTMILQPVDEQFSRPINKLWSHCLVCNKMILTRYEHAESSPNHNKYTIKKTKSQTSPQKNTNQIEKLDDKAGMTFCDVCNVHIHTHNFTSHTSGRKHKDNEIQANKKVIVQNAYNTLNSIPESKQNNDNSMTKSDMPSKVTVKANTNNSIKTGTKSDMPGNVAVKTNTDNSIKAVTKSDMPKKVTVKANIDNSINTRTKSDIPSKSTVKANTDNSTNSGTKSDMPSKVTVKPNTNDSINAGAKTDIPGKAPVKAITDNSINNVVKSDMPSKVTVKENTNNSINAGPKSDMPGKSTVKANADNSITAGTKSDMSSKVPVKANTDNSINAGTKSDMPSKVTVKANTDNSINAGTKTDMPGKVTVKPNNTNNSLNVGAKSDTSSKFAVKANTDNSINNVTKSDMPTKVAVKANTNDSINAGAKTNMPSKVAVKANTDNSINNVTKSDMPGKVTVRANTDNNIVTKSDMQSKVIVKANTDNSINAGSKSDMQSKVIIKPNNIEINRNNERLDINKYVMVIAPNGCDALATEDGFHSYKRVRSFIYCQVCCKWMSQDVAAHSVSNAHLKNIVQPIDNEFIRQVNATWQHCIICNEMTPTDTTHEHNPELIEQDVININLKNILKTICYPCYEYVHTCSFTAHKQTKSHKKNLKKSIEKNHNKNIPVHSKVTTTQNDTNEAVNFIDIANFELYFKIISSKYDLKLNSPLVDSNCIVIMNAKGMKERVDVDSFHSYKRSQVSVFCQMCQLSVSDDSEHCVRETHARHVIKPLDDHFARTINQAWRHCVLCNEMIFTGFDHVTNNPKHYKFNLPSTSRNFTKNTFNEELTGTTDTNIKVNEETAKVMPSTSTIENSKRIIEVKMSTNDKITTKKYSIKTQKEDTHILLNNNKIRKKSSDLFHCRLCDVDVKDYIIHINENLEHVKAKILDEGVDKEDLIRYVYNEESSERVISIAYKEIYEDLLIENKLKRISKLIFSCEACTLWLTRVNEIHHMFSNEHKRFLELNSM